jgi:hypothetical protein
VSEREDREKIAGRIFTYLLDVDPTEVQGPLAVYQSTVATRADTRLLIQAMVDILKGPEAWEHRFEAVWPKIEEDLKGIKRLLLRDVFDDFEDLFRRKTFDESISSCTGQSCVGDSREHSRRSWRCSERSAP